MFETEHFIVRDFQRIYRESREITTSPRQRVAVGISWANLECKKCGLATTARNGVNLENVIGAVLVSCSDCGLQESIPGGRFKSAE